MSSTTLTTTRSTTTPTTSPPASTPNPSSQLARSQLVQPHRTLRKPPSFANLNTSLASQHAASTPNLNSLYKSQSQSQSQSQSRLAPPATNPHNSAIARKASLAALTSSSLAAIPDVSETYGLNSVLSESPDRNMAPTTPGRSGAGSGSAGDDLVVGDAVDVPGNMHGLVRFVGPVQGKKGTFAGVELHSDFAARGKNSGDVDGVSYFSTDTAGAGIFLPLAKATKKSDSAGISTPFTPASSLGGLSGLKAGNQNSTNHSPPTPSLPKFSQSVGPGRAPSPQMKRPRPSLPRPESPVRRLMTPGPRPSIGAGATPGPKPPSRYGSPTTSRFAQSVRGTAGDPDKKLPRLDKKSSFGPRSASALGQNSGHADDDAKSMGPPRGGGGSQTNGSLGSISSLNSRLRPSSRANNDDEAERLRAQLEDRDKQLREQAATLAEMESSLTEVQALMENPDALHPRRSSLDDKDSTQLRSILREKNEKIAMLTAEFDAHRADFRSTIDTLEMASTETERVYEKRIEELQQENRDLESRTDDVDSVARQLKQLEELVQELEEGLEDARRGEAEARGEVEFLRGEVERTRAELRREREKVSSSGDAPGGAANAAGNEGANGTSTSSSSSKELEQKEDEIRGLKAIIHSLSRDSIPAGADAVDRPQHPPRSNSYAKGEVAPDARSYRERMEREMSDLRDMLDVKNNREEELEIELEKLRRTSVPNGGAGQRSSLRDSRDTVILARNRDSRSPEALKKGHMQGQRSLDAMAESDAYSTATENSTLWCEICETSGHDVLTCTQMFGDSAKSNGNVNGNEPQHQNQQRLRPVPRGEEHDEHKPAPLWPAKSKTPAATPTVHILPNPLESGPVAGKDSGVVDNSKWCALCERDGHDSVDCPFEDAF